ncbi:MAG: T9SS type A sorting domain-containing protein [Bacteroidetes bacterium]|nr:T9SS type A sorting domain-containing protein [Bacteroidota bacterium]
MGRDASGNSSGTDSYKIEFEVMNRSMVTHVMNYPNPFSTSTQFVFTLTGSSIPAVFTVQIMTISGKVVREITRAELGSIHIGRNITDYTWNGTDEYGDRLANGVYLYRVITKIDGESVEKMTTSGDQYFKKEFGKMYLFR